MTNALLALTFALAMGSGLPAGAAAERASEPSMPVAGRLDLGADHSCAAPSGRVRCWGFGGDGRLGYGRTDTIGDNETPAAAGPVDVGSGGTGMAISAGDFHTCAVLGDRTVRCWGFGGNGRLGYASTTSIGDDEAPGTVGPVYLGPGASAKAITAGGGHTCALLDDGTVRCWGFAGSGQLGYGSINNIGDDESPGSAGPVNLGAQRTATAITAGLRHTCAILDNGSVRCWGYGRDGELGYGNTENVGDRSTPDSVATVDLGSARKAVAITAAQSHTCAILDNGTVRCWGYGGDGELGYANTKSIGDDETPGSVGPVDLGTGHKAVAISAGQNHTCAILEDGTVRCWGLGIRGRLGYANTSNIGDDETPGSVGPVDLGQGRTAVAISAGGRHTCALLDDGHVRCWGYGGNGRLGYCNETSIGDDETPGTVGPVNLQPGDGGSGCLTASSDGSPIPSLVAPVHPPAAPISSDAMRGRGLRECLAAVVAHANGERRAAHHGAARRRARFRRHLSSHARFGRRRCLRLYGRTPGRIIGLRARAVGRTQIELTFKAPGTDGDHPPAAQRYLVKQSPRPIRDEADFVSAPSLCHGSCRFSPSAGGQAPGDAHGGGGPPETPGRRCLARTDASTFRPARRQSSASPPPARQATAGVGVLQVGACMSLAVIHLEPRTTYYYAVAARDNVSGHRGPRSLTVRVRTR